MNKLYQAGSLALLLGCAPAWANVPVTGRVDGSRFELTWQSRVNHEYTLMLSTNLVEGYSAFATAQATPPLNTWWEDLGPDARFYTVSRPVITNTPSSAPSVYNQIVNGDFSSDLDHWTKGTAGGAVATLSVSGGEALAQISDGSSAQWHVFLRQPGLTFSNGIIYTCKFEARSTAARDIQVIFQGDNGSGSNLKSTPVSIGTNMAAYEVSHAMTDPTQLVRLHFGLGNSTNDVWIDNVEMNNILSESASGSPRAVAHEMNRRMGRGNNFMAAKSMNDQGALEDYILLNTNYFHHCRIGYKMDEVCGPAPDYTLPPANLAVLQKMVDWCLSQGLIPIVDPVHNWANGPGFTTPDDLPKLSNIWVQVASHFAGYDLENVVFEIMNEPHANAPVAADAINAGLAAIRGVPGNETRCVIVAGDDFSTRQALIDAFDNDEIPADDAYLIGTFHYYDPRPFTKSTHASHTPFWGTSNEFEQVAADFDEVLTANTNWAVRNSTTPLPLYLGEFGVDNAVDDAGYDRKKWLSWIRLQAEQRGMSWAHWNMYNTNGTAKGMGPWTSNEINNPGLRTFEDDPVEAMIGRYEFEDGSRGGGVLTESTHAGYTGSGYSAFPTNTGSGVWARIDDIYIPRDDTYTLQLHYASAVDRTLRIVSRNDDDANVEVISAQLFPATGGFNSWKTLAVPVAFQAGHTNDLKVVALDDEGVQLDWLRITK
jgi:hypothetical protein